MSGSGLARRPVDPDKPLQVAAGPVALTITGGAVRWVRLDGIEIVHGIYGAVRDADWGTIEPRFESYEAATRDEAFEVRFRAACVREADGIDFAWTGTITGSPEGTIRFDLDGVARRPFVTARIGLCVLHPLRLSGHRVQVTTLFGELRGMFPELVTGYMPFSNIREIRQDLGGRRETRIQFAGDVFQTEDQRAFTDASFKTFSRPLELPQPYVIDAGSPVRQSVTITIPRFPTTNRSVTGGRRPSRTATLRLAAGPGRPFPAVGTGLAPADVELTPDVEQAVRRLGLAHLRAMIPVADEDAVGAVRRAFGAAQQAGCALEAVLVASPTDKGLEALLTEITASAVPVARIVAIDPAGHATPAALAARVRGALNAVGLRAPLAGGSRGYLYQLVAQGVPAELVDEVVFPTNPQVHAFDEASILETIDTLPVTVHTAATLAGGKPVVVGPVSLKALFNPDQVGPVQPLAPGALPDRYDARQTTEFAAAWTLGSAAALAGAGVAAMTLHEAAGWAGLVAAPHRDLPGMPAPTGTWLPVGEVTSALAELAGAEMLTVRTPGGWAATAVQLAPEQVRLLVANLRPRPGRLSIRPPQRLSTALTGRVLTVDIAGRCHWEPMGTLGSVVELPAYGVAVIDISRP